MDLKFKAQKQAKRRFFHSTTYSTYRIIMGIGRTMEKQTDFRRKRVAKTKVGHVRAKITLKQANMGHLVTPPFSPDG